MKKFFFLFFTIVLFSSTPAFASTENIYLTVEGKTLSIELVDNQAAKELKELLTKNSITIDMRDHGGFEKVGSLGNPLTSSDTSITTEAGDLILYQGNQLVIFYGSNTYSYTKLGKISNITQDELKNILGSDNVEITLSVNSFGAVPNTGVANFTNITKIIILLLAVTMIIFVYPLSHRLRKKYNA